MKTISAFFVIILSLSFAQASDPATCNSHESGANCTETKNTNGKYNDWSHKRAEQVADVLPQPVADKAKALKPNPVQLTEPKFMTKIDGTSVKLAWQPSELAKTYNLQVSKDAGFNNRAMYIKDVKDLTDTSFELTGLEPNTQYFWRVSAVNSDMRASYTKSKFTFSSFSTK